MSLPQLIIVMGMFLCAAGIGMRTRRSGPQLTALGLMLLILGLGLFISASTPPPWIDTTITLQSGNVAWPVIVDGFKQTWFLVYTQKSLPLDTLHAGASVMYHGTQYRLQKIEGTTLYVSEIAPVR